MKRQSKTKIRKAERPHLAVMRDLLTAMIAYTQHSVTPAPGRRKVAEVMREISKEGKNLLGH